MKKSFLLVVLMSLMGTVGSLGAQEPSQINNNPLAAAGNDVSAQITASPLFTAGNDTEIGGAHTLYATFVKYNTGAFKGAGTSHLRTTRPP